MIYYWCESGKEKVQAARIGYLQAYKAQAYNTHIQGATIPRIRRMVNAKLKNSPDFYWEYPGKEVGKQIPHPLPPLGQDQKDPRPPPRMLTGTPSEE